MNGRIIGTLVASDFRNFIRDKFVSIMMAAGMALFIAIYFLMPGKVEETIKIGLYLPQIPHLTGMLPREEGVEFYQAQSEEDLKREIMERRILFGISAPGDGGTSLQSGQRPRIFVYYPSDVPDEIKEMGTILVGEMINEAGGYRSGIEAAEIVLGPDMGGKQIPHRNRMLPLLVFVFLISETIGLANLITEEWRGGTVRALLTTPMTGVDFFAAKGITGLWMSLSQIFLLLILTGSLGRNALLIAVTLLLGALMINGAAFVIASASRDMMSVIGWGTLFMMLLAVPAITVMIPGPVAGWIKVIPSYYLVDILHRAINFGISWEGNLRGLLYLGGLDLAFNFLGIVALKRKLYES
ncbi:MAG: ABC transporter permease [Candidatus Krumholzibacteriota bacterium]|nr:ABC transporter permease [Candidatus Krumholzibacteriota bacterium]